MSSQQRVQRLLERLLCGWSSWHTPATAEEIRDWPCDAPFAEQFDPVQVWGSALPPLAGGWRQDAEVREVVEFAANPENPPRQGAKRIAKFAAPLGGAEREKRLMLVFAGLLDQFNLLRGFVIEGVRDFVVRAKILREAVDRNEAAAAALPASAEQQRRDHLEARAWDARRMDDALEEAEFLCHRYGYLDKKLRELTAGIELLFDQTGAGRIARNNREVKRYAKECLVAVDCPGLRPGASACTTDQDGQSQNVIRAEAADGEWTVYGGDLSNTRHAATDQINAENVKGLHLKWMFQTGVLGSFETTPIVEDGVMYITTPYNHVFAIDARTGQQLWHYEHKLGTTIFCCGPNNRGVALADDKIFMATLDAMLIALDKKTGALVWETQIADPEFGYSETVAPTVYQDKVILGISGAEYGIRGFISAYNKDTGELVWRWHTIPGPDEVQPDGTRAGTAISPRRRMASIRSTATSRRRRPLWPSTPTPGSGAAAQTG